MAAHAVAARAAGALRRSQPLRRRGWPWKDDVASESRCLALPVLQGTGAGGNHVIAPDFSLEFPREKSGEFEGKIRLAHGNQGQPRHITAVHAGLAAHGGHAHHVPPRPVTGSRSRPPLPARQSSRPRIGLLGVRHSMAPAAQQSQARVRAGPVVTGAVRAGPALDTAESLAQALSSKARLRARLSDKVAAMERRRPGPAWRTGRWDAEK